MFISMIIIIVLTITTQNSLQKFINTKCYPHLTNRGIVCLDKETMSSFENEGNIGYIDPRAIRVFQERSRDSTNEDTTASYEGIRTLQDKSKALLDNLRNVQEDVDQFNSGERVDVEHSRPQDDISVRSDKPDNEGDTGYKKHENLRNFQGEVHQYHNDDRENIESSKNRDGFSVDLDKSKSEKDEKHTKLRYSPQSANVSDREEEEDPLETLKYLRGSPKKDEVEYQKHASFQNSVGRNWKVNPSLNNMKQLEKRVLPGALILAIMGGVAEIAIGELIEKLTGN